MSNECVLTAVYRSIKLSGYFVLSEVIFSDKQPFNCCISTTPCPKKYAL